MISCLELPAVQDRPKLVFFFDEAHLLFDGATKAFVDSVIQTVPLMPSKGVGVFFITQAPEDLPGDVLGQLGNRIQTYPLRVGRPHARRAHAVAGSRRLARS